MRKVCVFLMLILLEGVLLGSTQQQEKVNINQATETQLQQLPGIGPALAKRIVEHRTKNGPFAKLVDLLNVSGIGTKKFESLESYITLGSGGSSPRSFGAFRRRAR